MKKLIVLVSGILLTLTATSFAGNDSAKPTVKTTAATCCSCPCGDNCKPGACPNNCGCCCDK